MAPGTRTAARGSEAPEPQVNNDQQAPPLATSAPTATNPTDDEVAAVQRRLTIAELDRKIAQADAERRAFEQENISNPGPNPAPKAQGAAALGAPQADPAETTGENLISPIVIKVKKLLVGVAIDDVNDVYTGKFEPWSLIRFHRSRGTRPSPDEPNSRIDVTGAGALTVKKKNYTAADYGPNPVVWASSFANYTFVYGRLFRERNPVDVLEAMNRFLEFILYQSESYQWKSCLEYAMTHEASPYSQIGMRPQPRSLARPPPEPDGPRFQSFYRPPTIAADVPEASAVQHHPDVQELQQCKGLHLPKLPQQPRVFHLRQQGARRARLRSDIGQRERDLVPPRGTEIAPGATSSFSAPPGFPIFFSLSTSPCSAPPGSSVRIPLR
ncbi:hypothetical protein E4U37_008393 [Claviceps purpurea]|nr:hypothetical protein E4U37_008393 [Claviceps purpurea]